MILAKALAFKQQTYDPQDMTRDTDAGFALVVRLGAHDFLKKLSLSSWCQRNEIKPKKSKQSCFEIGHSRGRFMRRRVFPKEQHLRMLLHLGMNARP